MIARRLPGIDGTRGTPYNAGVMRSLRREMPYLIDGHNLIPLVGLSLSDPDDEAKLELILQRYFARTGRRGTVYFDQQAPGATPRRTSRHLEVRFVSPPLTADDVIRKRLTSLRGEARNWAVVSNDQVLRRAAERVGARWLSADAFAEEVRSATQAGAGEKPDASLSPDDVAEYERLFRDRTHGNGQS